MESVGPDVINTSKYASRPGTLASKMKQLDGIVVSSRSRSLAEVASKVILEQNARMASSHEEVFAIEVSRCGSIFGRTHNYKKTLIRGGENFGKKLRVRVTNAHLRYLDCEVIDSKPLRPPNHCQPRACGLSSS